MENNNFIHTLDAVYNLCSEIKRIGKCRKRRNKKMRVVKELSCFQTTYNGFNRK